jgi:hypothetical protein
MKPLLNGCVSAWIIGALLASPSLPSAPTMFREKHDKKKPGPSITCSGDPLPAQQKQDKNAQVSLQTRSVTLSWKAPDPRSRKPEDGVKGYYIYRNVMSQDYAEKHRLNATPITATECMDTTVVPATTYFYSIRAVSQGGGQSDFSREIKITVPPQ